MCDLSAEQLLSKAAADLQAFVAAMPELSEQQLAMLLDSKPGLVARPVAEVSLLSQKLPPPPLRSRPAGA